MARYLFSRLWDRIPFTGIDRIDQAICRLAECFPDSWFDQND